VIGTFVQVRRAAAGRAKGGNAIDHGTDFGPNEKDQRANAGLSHLPIGCYPLRTLRRTLAREPNGPSLNRLFA